MYFSAILLTLAATASAVDVRAYSDTGCNGGWVGCANINPGVCCVFSNSASSGRLSVSVNAVRATSFFHLAYGPIETNKSQQIPSSWRIRGEANTGGGCTYLANQQDSNGNTDICMTYSSRGDRTGGSYSFVGRKRAADNSCPAEQPDGGKCEAGVKPDLLGLSDGTVYNIADLSDEKVEELVSFACNSRREVIMMCRMDADPLTGEDCQHRRWCRCCPCRVRAPSPLNRGLKPNGWSVMRVYVGTGGLDTTRIGWKYISD